MMEGRRMSMEAILARDQRTTSHRVLDRANFRAKGCCFGKGCSRGVNGRVNGTDRESCFVHEFYDDRGLGTRQPSVNSTTWLRLGSLLVTLLVVSVHGAPTKSLEERRLSLSPMWVNPCGLTADFTGDLDVTDSLTDSQLLSQVVLQAKTALMHAQLFRDNYVRQTFNTDLADLHSTFKDQRYDWLPGPEQIPKKLGETLDQGYLDRLELDVALVDAYEFMQKYAVGLEQIVLDQQEHQLKFHNDFKQTEDKLRSVLCELQVALVERQLAPRPDVSREIMPDDYRSFASETHRNLRDWLIFRDYMNALEYVEQVFEHLRLRLDS